jgi:PAS domain S-box-containing protein
MGGSVKILLVEDNPGDARLIRIYLSEVGAATFELTHAERLAEGISRVREADFDVVLLDLSLPDASGMETVNRMHEAAAARPIVVLTGLNDETVALEALRKGAQDYLIKGQIDSALLGRAIHYAIERKQAETALRESEERFRRAFEDSGVGKQLSGLDGRLLSVNRAFAAMLGYTVEELRSVDILAVTHPEDVAASREAKARLQSGSESGTRFEKRYLHKNGSVVWVDLSVVLLRDADGKPRHFVADAVDTTRRKLAEAEIKRQNAELAELNELKNQFLGMAAHDLRNPLTVVNMASSFLLDSSSKVLSAKQKGEFIRRINSNGEFMLKLINDLLDVAKIESGRLDLEYATGDLCGLIEENLTMNRMLAEKKGIRLDFAPECGLPPLRFDRGKVEQVLNNLIGNALNYSAPGTTVTVRAERVDGSVVVSVQDQGPGIPADELGHLFKPFSRTSVQSTAGEKSTGLGLAISRKIVDGHGGRIWAESEVGRGSTFSFSLPGADARPAAPEKARRRTSKQTRSAVPQ